MGNTKLRTLYVGKLLFEFTDEEHYLTTNQIVELLDSRYGIPAHR